MENPTDLRRLAIFGRFFSRKCKCIFLFFFSRDDVSFQSLQK